MISVKRGLISSLRQLPWLPWGGDSSPSPIQVSDVGERCGRPTRQPSSHSYMENSLLAVVAEVRTESPLSMN